MLSGQNTNTQSKIVCPHFRRSSMWLSHERLHGMGTCGPETEGENETSINQQRQHQTSLYWPTVCARFIRKIVKTFRQHGVSVYHKPVNTLRSILVHPKDKTPKDKKRGVIYEITWDQDPANVYIGETKRPLGKLFKEHTNLTIPTRVGDHCNATGHSVSLDNTKVLTREPQWTKRKVKEAILIKKRAPSMNREQVYQLPPIYHQLLLPEQFPRKET